MEKRRPKILEVNYLFMIVAILLIAVSSSIKFSSVYTQVLATHYLVIFLSVISFIIFRKYKFKKTLRLNKITFKQAMLSGLIPIFTYPIGLLFNYTTIIIISLFGKLQPSPLPIPENTTMFLIGLILFAITPAICEEIMFRGVILSAYERIGVKKAIVITGLLFGLFHFDVQNFLGPAFLGMLFAYMVYKTNSIYSSMIAHAMNNTIALVLLKIAGSMTVTKGLEKSQVLPEMPETKALIIGFPFIIMLAVSSSLVVYFLLKSLSKLSESKGDQNEEEKSIIREKINFAHIMPILSVVILFVFTAFRYFKFIMKT